MIVASLMRLPPGHSYGHSLAIITAALARLLDRYGAAELQAAITEALSGGVPDTNAVRLALERRRELRRQPPPIAVELPEHVRARDVTVSTHSLEPYDQLKGKPDESDEQS